MMSGPNGKSEVTATIVCVLLMIAMGVFLLVEWFTHA